jgi:hypothetical protein
LSALTGIVRTDALRTGVRFLALVNHLSRVILTPRRRAIQTGIIPLWLLWCVEEQRDPNPQSPHPIAISHCPLFFDLGLGV